MVQMAVGLDGKWRIAFSIAYFLFTLLSIFLSYLKQHG